MEFEYEYLNVLPETTVNKNTSADKECQVKECQFEMEPFTKHTDNSGKTPPPLFKKLFHGETTFYLKVYLLVSDFVSSLIYW